MNEDILPFESNKSIDSVVLSGERPEPSFDYVSEEIHWKLWEKAVFIFGIGCMVVGLLLCLYGLYIS